MKKIAMSNDFQCLFLESLHRNHWMVQLSASTENNFRFSHSSRFAANSFMNDNCERVHT